LLINLIESLAEKWKGINYPFLIHPDKSLKFSDITSQSNPNISMINQGDVVALIGDFDPLTILTLLQIIDKGAIVVPLTKETKEEHLYFFESALVDVVIEDGNFRRIEHQKKHEFIDTLRAKKHAGLVLFSTGTTGPPKAIIHDLTLFLERFKTPRPTLRTINFLLFDHIGGLNTLFHTLYNTGVIIAPKTRTVESILKICIDHSAELLPTTPTFLRMMLISGEIPSKIPTSLKVITYGTERMDQTTLDELCFLLPKVDFRQTFGMSELGIVRVKSKARDSLFMKIGGEGVKTRVIDGVLQIFSHTRMMGYLNAESPFDNDGWYDTKDVVEERDGCFKVTGRIGDVINVAGLKFMGSSVEDVALQFPNIELAKVYRCFNPITGEHAEILIQEREKIDRNAFKAFLKSKLPSHMMPKRIISEKIKIGHRFKIK
tara:strand:- start:4317 stop:5612 length:1296 start_codon:yes stop_codon:yes gene_type:complete